MNEKIKGGEVVMVERIKEEVVMAEEIERTEENEEVKNEEIKGGEVVMVEQIKQEVVMAEEIERTEENKEAPVEVVKLVEESNIEGKVPELTLLINNLVTGEWVIDSIRITDLTPKNLKSRIVANNGICPDADVICKNLENEFYYKLINGTLKVKNYHNTLGWRKVKDTYVFYGNETISADNEVNSIYCGDVDVSQEGSIENVINMINTLIIDQEKWSPLEAVLSAGVGATLLPYANLNWKASLNNIIIHMLGDSSTGKSTSLHLFVSLGSNPRPKEGFWINYNSSSDSVVKRIGYNYGFPVAVDELSNGSSKDYSNFVYTIGNGEEKDRLKAGGMSFQESATFQTSVLSSGEVSLYKKCAKNGGIRARCVELPNINWTASKEQAIAIKECTQENFGLVTPLVCQELVNNDAKWKERWIYWKKCVDDKMGKDGVKLAVSERIADFVALFTLSAEILNEVLEVSLDISKIFKFWYTYIIVVNEDEGNLGARAYSVINEYISMNKEKFADATYYGGALNMNGSINLSPNDDGCFMHTNKKRVINGQVCDMLCIFRRNVIENILSDAGFSDAKVCLHKLKEEKYLSSKDNGRYTYTKKYSINGMEVDCVAMYCKDSQYEADITFENN